jgi:hypothetical protein
LTGQHCTPQDVCVPDHGNSHSKVSRSSLRVVRQAPKYSTDGQCGRANGNLLCAADSKVYSGTCCSQYGWCGETPSHCKEGCQSGCDNKPAAAPAPAPTKAADPAPAKARDDGRCGKEFGGASCDPKGAFGGCCSKYG